MRYSEIHKRYIRGDDCCPFWRSDCGGICKGWPGCEDHPCEADENGRGCPFFSKKEG